MRKDEEIYVKQIIEKYADMVYKIALTRTGKVENAEDIFQEVFLIFSKKLPEFKNEEHEKAWFIKVTINKSKNLVMSSWNKKSVPLEENLVYENKEELEVFEEVNKLNKNYKTVIYLMYYEGYKVKEIADLMKENENTIKTWLSRARSILKKSIGGFEDE